MKILIIIPTYNESDNVRAITSAVLAVYPDVEILIVDDNSPDGTGQLVLSTGTMVEVSRRRWRPLLDQLEA